MLEVSLATIPMIWCPRPLCRPCFMLKRSCHSWYLQCRSTRVSAFTPVPQSPMPQRRNEKDIPKLGLRWDIYYEHWRHAESCVHRVVRQMIGWINISYMIFYFSRTFYCFFDTSCDMRLCANNFSSRNRIFLNWATFGNNCDWKVSSNWEMKNLAVPFVIIDVGHHHHRAQPLMTQSRPNRRRRGGGVTIQPLFFLCEMFHDDYRLLIVQWCCNWLKIVHSWGAEWKTVIVITFDTLWFLAGLRWSVHLWCLI